MKICTTTKLCCTLSLSTVAAAGLLTTSAIGGGEFSPSNKTAVGALQYLNGAPVVNTNAVVRDRAAIGVRGGAPGSGTPTGTTYSVNHAVGDSGGVGFFVLCDPSVDPNDDIVTFDAVAEPGCTPVPEIDTAATATITESVAITGVSPNREWTIQITSSVPAGRDLFPAVVLNQDGIEIPLNDGALIIGGDDALAWDPGLAITSAGWRVESAGAELFNFDFTGAFFPPAFCYEGFLAPIVLNLTGAASDLSEFTFIVSESPDPAIPDPFCPEDFAPVEDGGNGQVNIDDLLGTVSAFGNSGLPRDPADVTPNPCGNWAVNIDDLLAVVSAFGPCPGVPGDVCENGPIAIGGGGRGDVSLQINTAGATTDGPEHDPECDQFATGNPQIFNDLWYCYTASCGTVDDPARLNVSLAGSDYDTKLALYDGCSCPTDASSLLACNDDANGTLQSEIELTGVIAGDEILVRIGSFSAAATGIVQLAVDCIPPDSDFCIDANELVVDGAELTDNNVAATIESPAADNCPGGAPDQADGGRWFALTGLTAGNEVTISTCFDNTEFGFSFYNTFVNVYCAGCDILQCIGDSAEDGSNCAFGPFSSFTFCPDETEDYRVLVHGLDNGGSAEDYRISATTGAACATPAPCGLEGDFCDNPIAVADGVNNFDSSGNSTTLQDGVDLVNQCEFGDAQLQDIWFTYTASCTGAVVMQTCGSSFDSAMSVFLGNVDCDTINGADALDCADDTEPCAAEFNNEVQFDATAGESYIVVVSGWQGGGAGVLTIDCGNPPTGACCDLDTCIGTLTEAQCAAQSDCGIWVRDESCDDFVCDPGCAGSVFTNGIFDCVNGTRPADGIGGWASNGVIEDFEFATGSGATFTNVSSWWLENTSAGTTSAFATYVVRIYDLGAGTLADLDFDTSVPVACFESTAADLTKSTDVTVCFAGFDTELVVIDVTDAEDCNGNSLGGAGITLADGRYALYLQVADAPAGAGVFWATSPGASCATESGRIFGPGGTNGDAGAQFAFCLN